MNITTLIRTLIRGFGASNNRRVTVHPEPVVDAGWDNEEDWILVDIDDWVLVEDPIWLII